MLIQIILLGESTSRHFGRHLFHSSKNLRLRWLWYPLMDIFRSILYILGTCIYLKLLWDCGVHPYRSCWLICVSTRHRLFWFQSIQLHPAHGIMMWWKSCQTVLTTTHFILSFVDLLTIKTLFINFLRIIWSCLNDALYVSWVIFVVFWRHIYRLEGLRIGCVTDAQSVTRKQILIIVLLTVWFGNYCSINIRAHVLIDSVVHIFL